LSARLELRFETPVAQVDLQGQLRPGVAQLLRQFETRDLRKFANQHQINLRPLPQ